MLKRSKTILLLSLILVSGILSFVSAKHERHLNGNASADSGSQEDSTNAVSNDKSNEGKDGGNVNIRHLKFDFTSFYTFRRQNDDRMRTRDENLFAYPFLDSFLHF